MSGYVLVADGIERRASERIEQLLLDGCDARAAWRPLQARELLRRARLLVLGEFNGSAALAQDLLRDLRAGSVPGVDPRLRVIATADSEAQVISALAAGADLTVPRSGSPSLVSASVAALERRGGLADGPGRLKVGGLEIDAAGREATLDGKPVRLTARELDVLTALARVPGRVFTREELSWEVWGGPDLNTSRAVNAHVSRMAAKFRAAGADLVHTVHGRGWKLVNDPRGIER